MADRVTITHNNVWIPFVRSNIVLAANAEAVEEVSSSVPQGLGEPARCGKVENNGPGELTYRVVDSRRNSSRERILKSGGMDAYLLEERVEIATLHLKADGAGCSYNLILTAKAPERIELVTKDETGAERVVTGFILGEGVL